MSILDFYYNHLKNKYGDRCNLLYTDTDSLLLEIKTEDIYKDMSEDKDLYDFSNYSSNYFIYFDVNKNVIDTFKDETGGDLIREYVGLRPKMYSVLLENKKSIKRAKGVKSMY